MNQKITILSKNCLAGCIYYTLGMEFCSPTINLWFENDDFYKFVFNLEEYIRCELIEETGQLYPSATIKGMNGLDDLHIMSVHYNSFEHGKNDWYKRINLNKVVVFDTLGSDYPNYIPLVNRTRYLKTGLVFDKKSVNELLYFSKYLNNQKFDGSEILTYKGFFGKRKFDKIKLAEIIDKM